MGKRRTVSVRSTSIAINEGISCHQRVGKIACLLPQQARATELEQINNDKEDTFRDGSSLKIPVVDYGAGRDFM